MIAIEVLMLIIRLVFIFFIDEGQGLLAIHRGRFSTRTPANHLNYPFLESQLPWLLYRCRLCDRPLGSVYLALIVLSFT